MSLEFSDAELRRLRDHDALLTHVGITTLSDVDCQASMDRMLLKFATLSAQEIPKLKSLASFKILTFKDLKAAKMALATKEDAEPVLRLAKLMGLIGGNFSGSTLDVFILASQQAGARDFAQVQAVSLPEASPPPPASESAMTASAPADNLVAVVETPQLPRSHKRVVPMCANNSQITTFFVVAPPSAAQMRGQWQRWLAAGDLGYAPYARFVSDLQKMGDGTYVNIALEDNAFRELYRLVWFSININAVILEATFNQLDNQMVKKTPMGPEVLQGRVLYTANVLSAHHKTRRSEHVPKELNAPRGKVAARVPGAVRVGTRERIVQTHASMVRASELVKKRSYEVYRGAPRVDVSERLIKSTKATYAAKYVKDCVAQTQRAAARAPIDWAERARQQGGLEKKGSSCTGVNLAQICIDPIREMVVTFGLDGMETAAKIKAQMTKPGKAVVGGEATAAVKALLAAPRLREILEEQLKKLFDDNDMQTFGAHKRTLQLLREKNNSKGSDATASEQTARKKARNSASPAVA